MVTFFWLVHQARIISRVSPAFFSSSFNRSIMLPFSELMEQEPRRHLVLNCLHRTFAVEYLPVHFLRVSRRNVTLRRVQSLFLSVIFFNKSLREGTFFLGGGEGWGILVFFPKKVLALPCVFIKKNS